MTGPLSGLKVLDLSRILAGPTCTQLLADMGADVIKVENPLTAGDDTRSWGPPFVDELESNVADLSAYFVCANRNKRSIAIDLASAEGQATIKQLAAPAETSAGFRDFNIDTLSLLVASLETACTSASLCRNVCAEHEGEKGSQNEGSHVTIRKEMTQSGEPWATAVD